MFSKSKGLLLSNSQFLMKGHNKRLQGQRIDKTMAKPNQATINSLFETAHWGLITWYIGQLNIITRRSRILTQSVTNKLRLINLIPQGTYPERTIVEYDGEGIELKPKFKGLDRTAYFIAIICDGIFNYVLFVCCCCCLGLVCNLSLQKVV